MSQTAGYRFIKRLAAAHTTLAYSDISTDTERPLPVVVTTGLKCKATLRNAVPWPTSSGHLVGVWGL